MMTNRNTVEYKISEIFEQKLHLAVPSADMDLFESGSLDSFSFVDLLLQLELAYNIKIPLQDLELANFRSIERIADFIRLSLVENSQPEPQYMYGEAKCLA